MTRKRAALPLLLLPIIVIAAPPARSQAKKPTPIKPVKNVFTGRVTDVAGKPLPNVTVGIYGTTNAGENTRFEVQTNANGIYRQRVPAGIYGATAEYHKRFNDAEFRFYPMPNDGTTAKKHDSERGVVKNFTWKISGLKPGERAGKPGTHTEPNKYYGNSAQISVKEVGFDAYVFPAGSSIELLFTPTGKLIDGSTGKPQKRVFSFTTETKSSSQYLYCTDLPLGNYSVVATYAKADGSRETLGIKRSLDFNGDLKPSLHLPLKAGSFGDTEREQITIDRPKG